MWKKRQDLHTIKAHHFSKPLAGWLRNPTFFQSDQQPHFLKLSAKLENMTRRSPSCLPSCTVKTWGLKTTHNFLMKWCPGFAKTAFIAKFSLKGLSRRIFYRQLGNVLFVINNAEPLILVPLNRQLLRVAGCATSDIWTRKSFRKCPTHTVGVKWTFATEPKISTTSTSPASCARMDSQNVQQRPTYVHTSGISFPIVKFSSVPKTRANAKKPTAYRHHSSTLKHLLDAVWLVDLLSGQVPPPPSPSPPISWIYGIQDVKLWAPNETEVTMKIADLSPSFK